MYPWKFFLSENGPLYLGKHDLLLPQEFEWKISHMPTPRNLQCTKKKSRGNCELLFTLEIFFIPFLSFLKSMLYKESVGRVECRPCSQERSHGGPDPLFFRTILPKLGGGGGGVISFITRLFPKSRYKFKQKILCVTWP